MSDTEDYVIDRVFDAPRAMVWKAWTDPVLLARWYGPNIETIIHEFDLRPGGVWLNEMKMGERSSRSRADFTEILPEERLAWDQSETDAHWQPTVSQMMPDWPRVISTMVTFEADGDKTNLRLVWTPKEASDAELACFRNMVANMGKGWGAGFGIIDEILAELQAADT